MIVEELAQAQPVYKTLEDRQRSNPPRVEDASARARTGRLNRRSVSILPMTHSGFPLNSPLQRRGEADANLLTLGQNVAWPARYSPQ
jgi:hypothetical protein